MIAKRFAQTDFSHRRSGRSVPAEMSVNQRTSPVHQSTKIPGTLSKAFDLAEASGDVGTAPGSMSFGSGMRHFRYGNGTRHFNYGNGVRQFGYGSGTRHFAVEGDSKDASPAPSRRDTTE